MCWTFLPFWCCGLCHSLCLECLPSQLRALEYWPVSRVYDFIQELREKGEPRKGNFIFSWWRSVNRLLAVLLLCAHFNLWPSVLFLSDKKKSKFLFFFNFQMGTFKAHDGEYFLEPIMKADGSEHEDDHNKPHLIYRQELKRNYFLHSHKPCDISGKLWSASIWVKIRYYVTLFID